MACASWSGRVYIRNFRTTNQFVSYRVPVKGNLKPTGNKLVIAFESAFRKVCDIILDMAVELRLFARVQGRQLEKDNGGKRLLWNGDSSRLHVRKAQYK